MTWVEMTESWSPFRAVKSGPKNPFEDMRTKWNHHRHPPPARSGETRNPVGVSVCFLGRNQASERKACFQHESQRLASALQLGREWIQGEKQQMRVFTIFCSPAGKPSGSDKVPKLPGHWISQEVKLWPLEAFPSEFSQAGENRKKKPNVVQELISQMWEDFLST